MAGGPLSMIRPPATAPLGGSLTPSLAALGGALSDIISLLVHDPNDLLAAQHAYDKLHCGRCVATHK